MSFISVDIIVLVLEPIKEPRPGCEHSPNRVHDPDGGLFSVLSDLRMAAFVDRPSSYVIALTSTTS